MSIPYQEPPILTILTLSSFLFILNAINFLLNRWIYCGLLGQILIGIVWGTPGFGWLSSRSMLMIMHQGKVEDVVMQFGYLGLILLVYEGGLVTSFTTLKQGNILSISIVVAITGIIIPIALSFAILPALLSSGGNASSASPLQAFAAGASLCSTSLGTTFTVLSTTGLAQTRLGTILTSAAMLDDVVGLVMVQVITNLGRLTTGTSTTGSASEWVMVVVRPILVSVGFVVVVMLVCRFGVGMLLRMRVRKRAAAALPLALKTDEALLLLHTCILLAMVAASSYAGTSNLFAAYLAGAAISWADADASSLRESDDDDDDDDDDGNHVPANVDGDGSATGGATASSTTSPDRDITGQEARQDDGIDALPSGLRIFERYYAEPLRRILQPMFFASIGFSIPIRQMFRGSVVWKGIVYAILMALAKLATGIWLIRISPLSSPVLSIKSLVSKMWPRKQKSLRQESKPTAPETNTSSQTKTTEPQPTSSATPSSPIPESTDPPFASPPPPLPTPKNPISLYPASILGMAMVARGEIGYLIASLAKSRGIFSDGTAHSETYLVVIWAISLCTLVAPVSVGFLVRRMKRLQRRRDGSGGAPDPLGIWGI